MTYLIKSHPLLSFYHATRVALRRLKWKRITAYCSEEKVGAVQVHYANGKY